LPGVVFFLVVALIVSFFASLGWRDVVRDAREALLLLFLFTVWLWGERGSFPHARRNWFLVFFFCFAFYGLLQILFHPEISFAVREHALRFPCYFIAAFFAFYFSQKESSLRFLLSRVSIVGAAFAILISALVLKNINFGRSGEVLRLGLSGRFWPSQWLAVPFVENWVSPHFYVNNLVYLFELTVFLPLGLLFHRITSLWERGKSWSIAWDPEVLFWAATFLTTAGAIFVLHSRGALIAFFAGLFLFLFLLMLKRAPWTMIVFLLMIGALYWFGIQPTIGELQTIPGDITAAGGLKVQASLTCRVEAWQTMTRIFISHFWLGSGPGSYPILYFAYKPYSAFPAFTSRLAYNDALQLLAELGVIGGALFLAVLAAYLFTFLRAVFLSHEWTLRFFGASALTCGIAVAFFHSLVGSGLQCFPMACLAALLAGACMGACQSPEAQATKPKKIVLFMVTAGVFLLGMTIFRWWIMPWSEASSDPLEDALIKVKIDPSHPDHHARLGDIYLAKALGKQIPGTAKPHVGEIALVRIDDPRSALPDETRAKERARYLEMALQEYEMMPKLNPYTFEYFDKMARVYIEQKNYAAASQILKDWEGWFPNASDVEAKAAPYYLEIAEREKAENSSV